MRKHRRLSELRTGDISAWMGAHAGLAVFLWAIVCLSLQGCSNPKAMDVIWSADLVDHNGFARNPVWQQQTQTGQPPDPCAFCPCQNEDPQAWHAAANCTDQMLHFNSSFWCSGHMNWLPVAYEGTVTWGGHSDSLFDDADYFFYVKRPDQALKTAAQGDTRDGTEIEFDHQETVDYWDNTNTWWEHFHNYVDHNDDQAIGNHFGVRNAIVIGLVGLDTQHEVHSELHPVYAMFVHVQDDAAQDRWAFFVRNWGNEGGCGSDQEPLPLIGNKLQVLIPHTSGPSFSLDGANVWAYGDDEDEFKLEGWSYQRTNEGLLLTFGLRDPSKQVGFVGDLTINWGQGTGLGDTAPAKLTAPQARPSRALTEQGDGDMALRAKIEKLDPAAQKLLSQQVKNLTHHPSCQKIAGTLSTAAPPERVKPTGKYPTYGNNVKSVRDTAGQARKTKEREFILAFLKAHGIE
jgi:hypothetical protein